MTTTKSYPLQRIINWYHGNFCTRKFFGKDKKIFDCHLKFQRLADQNKGLMMTQKEFKDLLDNDHIKICKLTPRFRRRIVTWKQFEEWLRDPSFDPDKFDS